MAIYFKDKKVTPYKGSYKPLNIYKGHTKIAGWKETAQSGTDLTFEDTYNDNVLSAKVKGNTVQKSEWVGAEAVSGQVQTEQGKNLFDMSRSNLYNPEKKCLVATSYAQSTKVYLKDYLGDRVSVGDTIVLSGITEAPSRNYIYLGDSAGFSWNFGSSRLLTADMMNSRVFIYVESSSSPIPTDIYLQMKLGSVASANEFEPFTPNSPSPEYQSPVMPFLAPDTYKTQDWRGDWYEFTLTEDLHGIDDVRDSVEWDKYNSSVGRLDKRYGKKVFDGTEAEWVAESHATAFNGINFYIPLNNSVPNRSPYNGFLKSSHTKVSFSVVIGDYSFVSVGRNLNIQNGFSKTLIDFKAWLAAQYTAGTPVTIVYQLATPTRTPLIFTKNNASTASECPMEFLVDETGVSPDYPATVISAGDCEIRSQGRNLFDASPWSTPTTSDGITVQYLSSEDCFVINGTATTASERAGRYINLFGVKSSGYSLSAKYVSGTIHRPGGTEVAVAYFGTANTTNTYSNWQPVDLRELDTLNQNKLLSHSYITRFWFYISAGVTFNNYKVRIQLEHNVAAQSYQPYFSSSSIVIPELSGLPDGTADTLEYIGDGDWKHTQRRGKKILTGDETYTLLLEAEGFNTYYTTISGKAFGLGKTKCTHFKNDGSNNNIGGLYTISDRTGNNALSFAVPKTVTSVAEMKAYIASIAPVEIEYELVEPVVSIINLGELKSIPRETNIDQLTDGLKAELQLTAKVVDKSV